MRFSIAFQGDKSPREYEALAGLVDRYDFDAVSVYNDLMFQPALGPLLLMAPKLRRAHLGPAALNPFTLHPVEIAGQAAMLDLVSARPRVPGPGARRVAGTDRRDRDARRCRRLREAVLVVRHLLARERRGPSRARSSASRPGRR